MTVTTPHVPHAVVDGDVGVAVDVAVDGGGDGDVSDNGNANRRARAGTAGGFCPHVAVAAHVDEQSAVVDE